MPDAVEELVRLQIDKVIQGLSSYDYQWSSIHRFTSIDYLKLADETDLDVLNNSIEVMVETYSEELVPVATQLTTRLVGFDVLLTAIRDRLIMFAYA